MGSHFTSCLRGFLPLELPQQQPQPLEQQPLEPVENQEEPVVVEPPEPLEPPPPLAQLDGPGFGDTPEEAWSEQPCPCCYYTLSGTDDQGKFTTGWR